MKYIILLAFVASAAAADPPQIIDAKAMQHSNGWRLDVTLAHADTGWEDYADGWRVELENGEVLGTRILSHPHVTEQPFTRSLSGVDIPKTVDTIFIRARDLIGGWSDIRHAIDVTR